jgi:hypothetical protein
MNERLVRAMEAIEKMPSVPVKGGKQYVMVKDRIEVFRQEFGDEYGIETMVDYEQGFADGAPVVCSARIVDQNNRVIATGWAVEFVGSTQITDASPVEVAETSAIGRALACFGLHGGEYASLNEIEAAQRKQEFRGGVGNGHGHRPPPPPPQRQQSASPFYVPDHDGVYTQPDREKDNIIQQVEAIRTTQELGKYWSDLKQTVGVFNQQDGGADLIAEVKAAFATRHNFLGEKQ